MLPEARLAGAIANSEDVECCGAMVDEVEYECRDHSGNNRDEYEKADVT